MGRERPLDLVVRVFALLVGVTMMADRRAGTGRGIFLLGADPGEIDGLTGPLTVTISLNRPLVHSDGL